MPKIAYLECPTGIAGDMCLGALVHAGVPLEYLIEQLGRSGIADEFKLWAESVQRNGQQATKVHVDRLIPNQLAESSYIHAHEHPHHDPDHAFKHPYHEHPHHERPHHEHTHQPSQSQSQTTTPATPSRNLPDIEQLIRAASLPAKAETWSLAVFRQLAIAEGAVHGIPPEQVHFHEVGAIDAIVDIVGTCLGLEWLGIEQLYCSALPTGGGTVWAVHGRLPVPAPAVLKLWELRQVPIYSNGIDRELVTPTGAAIATTLAASFGAPPPMTLQCVGLGAGSQDLMIPNILRLWIGERSDALVSNSLPSAVTEAVIPEIGEAIVSRSQFPTDQIPTEVLSEVFSGLEAVAVLETQIDDLNPQAIGYVFEALFEAGALDVFTQAIGMKKSRPGILLTVICRPGQIEACETVIFRETTTLGIRRLSQLRTALSREIQTTQTAYGAVRIKVARSHPAAEISNIQPEYEDCAKLARQHKIPWREIHRLALQSWIAQTRLAH
jgi:pyridinium-3,5-bisthiocarboxylic acid mononucleotide nickel chelatase